MNVDAYRDLQLLTEISSQESITQRSLAKRYQLALGLTNFLMHRLVKKGYVKIAHLERKRLRYLITPQGVAEKARLTYEYLEYSLYFYRQIRMFLERALTVIVESGKKDVVLYGTGEVAEVAFLIMQQHGVKIVAVIDQGASGRAVFMNHTVRRPADIQGRAYDWVVVALLKDAQQVIRQLCQDGMPERKILSIPDRGYTPVIPDALSDVNVDSPVAVEGARS